MLLRLQSKAKDQLRQWFYCIILENFTTLNNGGFPTSSETITNPRLVYDTTCIIIVMNLLQIIKKYPEKKQNSFNRFESAIATINFTLLQHATQFYVSRYFSINWTSLLSWTFLMTSNCWSFWYQNYGRSEWYSSVQHSVWSLIQSKLKSRYYFKRPFPTRKLSRFP